MTWYVQFESDPFALAIYPKEDTFESAKEFIRNWLGVKRLPNNTQIWKG